MAYEVNDKEFKAVLSLPEAERYDHFIKRVADWEVVWTAGSDGKYALVADDAGQEMLPVWPHERYVVAFVGEERDGNLPESIELDRFLAAWLPGLQRDGFLVAVFPTPEGKGPVVAPEQLKRDLEAYIEEAFG